MPTDPSSHAIESPGFLAAIIETTKDAIIGETPDGIVTSWNRAAENIFQFSAAEMIGGPLSRIIPSERLREQRDVLHRVRHHERIESLESVFRRKDGSNVDVSISVSPIHDAVGEVIGASCIIRDFTERRLMDQRQRKHFQEEKDDRFATVIQHMSEGLVLLDLSGQILHWNPAAMEMHGFKGGTVLPLHLRDFAELFELRTPSGELIPFEEWPLNRVQRGASLRRLDLRIRRRDIDWERVFSYSGDRVRERDGNEIAFLAITDITRRSEAEARLRQQAALLDHAREAILLRDLEGKLLFWSKGAERIYEWTREEVIGKEASRLLYKSSDAFRIGTADVLESGDWAGEIEQVTKSGRAITVEGRWTLLRDDKGVPNAILAINLDVTAKKRMEAQYLRAQRMESIGTLAGGVAHDLNNMLAPILMSVELLRGKLPEPRDQELLNMLEEGATRGADLVRQILTFARGFETRQILVNPKHTIREVSRILRDTLLQKITVQTEVDDNVWSLLGDPTQLHQVLLNLCVNARDAMPNGGALTIRAENQMLDENYAAMHLDAKAGPYVVISIVDTGSGIPAEIREKIFDPFFTTKEVGKGTGLGLSTTSGIVKSHGGFINLYSEVGHGTTFSVYLPAELNGASPALPEEFDRLARGNGELILVADDEASVRNITIQTLETFGYRAVCASDGAEALGVYAKNLSEVRAVLTDMMMPYMDGPATIRAIRRLNSEVIIIAATGLGTDVQKQAALSAGADYFLQKPFSAEAVLSLLHQALTEARHA